MLEVIFTDQSRPRSPLGCCGIGGIKFGLGHVRSSVLTHLQTRGTNHNNF